MGDPPGKYVGKFSQHENKGQIRAWVNLRGIWMWGVLRNPTKTRVGSKSLIGKFCKWLGGLHFAPLISMELCLLCLYISESDYASIWYTSVRLTRLRICPTWLRTSDSDYKSVWYIFVCLTLITICSIYFYLFGPGYESVRYDVGIWICLLCSCTSESEYALSEILWYVWLWWKICLI